jgi:hypothetical protein
MDRRGHAIQGMDSFYVHVTDDMRKQLCDYLQRLWEKGIAGRYKLAPRSAVPLLDEILVAHHKKVTREATERSAETANQQRLRSSRMQARWAAREARARHFMTPRHLVGRSGYHRYRGETRQRVLSQARGRPPR